MIEQTIGTAVIAVFGWLLSEKFLLPEIVKIYKWFKEKKQIEDQHNLDTSKELVDLKDKTDTTYEHQIEFLTNQIDELEKQLLDYSEVLKELRKEILILNQRLFKKSVALTKLRNLCCANENCVERIHCTDEICKKLGLENEMPVKKDIP